MTLRGQITDSWISDNFNLKFWCWRMNIWISFIIYLKEQELYFAIFFWEAFFYIFLFFLEFGLNSPYLPPTIISTWNFDVGWWIYEYYILSVWKIINSNLHQSWAWGEALIGMKNRRSYCITLLMLCQS